MYRDRSTPPRGQCTDSRHHSENQTTDDDAWEYRIPPIGAVAFMPDGCPGTIARVLHTPRATWFFIQPGGWFPEHRLIYGQRKLT